MGNARRKEGAARSLENLCISGPDQGRGVSTGIGGAAVREGGEKVVSRKPHVQPALHRTAGELCGALRLLSLHTASLAPFSSSPAPLWSLKYCSAVYRKTLNTFYKVSSIIISSVSRFTNIKRCNFSTSLGKSGAVELRVLQALVQMPNSQILTSK